MAFRIAEVPVSRSTRMVFPRRESAREKLIANVVLPTPPFPDEMGMMRLMGTGTRSSLASDRIGRSADVPLPKIRAVPGARRPRVGVGRCRREDAAVRQG